MQPSSPHEPGAVGVSEQDPLLGRLMDGRYRLDEVIARGGMATVFLSTDTRLDRIVAVKVMRPVLAEDPDFVERFAREARSAARLSSPEVVAVHDQGTDAATRTAFLVMEYVKGGTLRDVVEQGPVSPVRALALLEPVLRALAAAHGAGLIHRDVKPENVLLGDDGRVKVADFGLARAIETSTLTVTTGLLIGTVAYLAPEQVEHGRADTRTDVYAAGVLLFELLTGAPNTLLAAKQLLGWGLTSVVAKQGKYGAQLFTAEGQFAVPAFPLEHVADPTGAGDSFAGGFVGYVAASGGAVTHDVLVNAMAYGTALASFNVEDFGTERVAVLTGAEIEERVRVLELITTFENRPVTLKA